MTYRQRRSLSRPSNDFIGALHRNIRRVPIPIIVAVSVVLLGVIALLAPRGVIVRRGAIGVLAILLLLVIVLIVAVSEYDRLIAESETDLVGTE